MTVSNVQIEAPEETPETEPHRTLLEVWKELLKPAAENAKQPISLQWAVRLKDLYPHLTFEDLDAVRTRYFEKLAQLVEILHIEIATDPDCFTRDTIESDADENREHYRNLLMLWQQCFILWENEWRATNPDAAVEAASIAETHKMFFGPNGLVNHLDSINFEFTETDQAEMTEDLLSFDASLKAGSSE